jgi:hypothetical protein
MVRKAKLKAREQFDPSFFTAIVRSDRDVLWEGH